jgi:hypothetical protein
VDDLYERPAVLERALAGSATVIVATEVVATGVVPTVVIGAGVVPTVTGAAYGDRVVGLARVVSDGETICYLQDVLVHPSVQRMGLGVGWSRRCSSRMHRSGRRCC